MSEITEEALKQGWVDKDDWKGDPDQWRPAEEFVERGNNILPIVKDRLSKTEKEVEELKKQLKASSQITEEQINTLRKDAAEQAKRDYDAKLKDLNAKSFEAVQSGDVDEWQKVEEQKADLKPPEALPDKEKQTNPVFDDWKKENEWYDTDTAATSLAMGYAAQLDADVKSGKVAGMTEAEFYGKVGEYVRNELPHKFENPKRNQADMAEGAGHSSTSGKGKAYADLPADAKAALKKHETEFKTKGWKFDKESWIKTYFEE